MCPSLEPAARWAIIFHKGANSYQKSYFFLKIQYTLGRIPIGISQKQKNHKLWVSYYIGKMNIFYNISQKSDDFDFRSRITLWNGYNFWYMLKGPNRWYFPPIFTCKFAYSLLKNVFHKWFHSPYMITLLQDQIYMNNHIWWVKLNVETCFSKSCMWIYK